MVFKVFDGPEFHRILLGVIRFSVLVLNVHCPIDLKDFLTLFLFGIVPLEGNQAALFSDKILIYVGKFLFGFHAIDIDNMGFPAKENLRTSITMVYTSAVDKKRSVETVALSL